MARLRPKYHHRAVFFSDPGDDTPPDRDQGVGFTKCLHKRSSRDLPFLVANELIAAALGQFLGLPVPPFAVTYSADGQFWFSSLYFNFDQEELPAVLPDQAWKSRPGLIAGITVFDVWIANADRHDKNLVVDHPLHPTAIKVIDHDQALFGGGAALRGKERLETAKNRLGVTHDTCGMRNDFIEFIDDSSKLNPWINRIHDIPDWVIKNCVGSAKGYGIDRQEKMQCCDFLLHRRDKIHDILLSERACFPGISEWKLSGRLPF